MEDAVSVINLALFTSLGITFKYRKMADKHILA